MARTVTQPNSVLGRFEADLEHQFLPGCRQCGGAHPLAISSKLDPTVCPNCGAPAGEPGQSVLVPSTHSLTGVSAFFARLFLQAGASLRDLAERLKR